ncbi:MAG: hypothetical protein RL112_2025 [Planctomycetota bacterium]|jgi:nucleotide-binding universal stress UspA family protein
MTILFGTDFSAAATAAMRGAGAWARKLGEDVVCAHSVDIPDIAWAAAAEAPIAVGQWYEAQREHAQVRAALMAQELSHGGTRARAEILSGHPDDQLVERARELKASCIAVGATGHRGIAAWRLGSTADRVSQKAELPVLVLRDPAPLEAWADGEPLKVMVALEADAASDAALRHAIELRRKAEIELVVAHVWWPPEHGEGAGLGATGDLKTRAALEKDIEAGLRRRLVERGIAEDEARLRLVPGFGKPAEHLAQIATEERAGLVLLGTHHRRGLARLWHGSVSRDALVGCPTNAMVVPT